jgi:hypothetical protein
MTKLEVTFPISEELALEAAIRYPNIELVEKAKHKLSTHQHPLSSIERRVTETKLYQMAVSDGFTNIVDIGGNPLRHAQMKRSIHSCNPVLTPTDNSRNERYRSQNRSTVTPGRKIRSLRTMFYPSVTFCEHPIEYCTCVKPDCFLAIHSLYYFTPDQLLKLLYSTVRGKIYASCHLFDKLVGDMFTVNKKSEAHYEFQVSGDINMLVKGNYIPYRHGNVEWLNKMYHDDGNHGMSWSIDMIGETAMVVFSKCLPIPKVDKPMNITDKLSDTSYYGEFVLSMNGDKVLKSEMRLDTIMSSRLLSIGKYVIAHDTQQRKVIIPKGVVDIVASKMIGKSRNAKTWKECISYSRKELSESKYLMPQSIRVQSILYVAALSFVKYMDEEIRITHAMVKENKYKFTWYDKVLAFSSLACCFFGKSDIGCPVERYNTSNGASSCSSKIYVNPDKKYAYVRVDRKLAPLKEGASLAENGNAEITAPKDFFQIGVGFSDHIPVVPLNCENNEKIALNNRALMKTDAPVKLMWDRIIDFISDLGTAEVIPLTFEEWNSNFPLGRRKEHEVARQQLEDEGINYQDVLRNLFIKMESYNKGTLEGSENFDPRAIQGTSHKANVALGPWMAGFNKYLKKLFSPQSHVCYASGMTGEEVGTWMKDALEEIDDPIFFWSDFSRFDATQGSGAFRFERRMYEFCGLKKDMEARAVFLAQKKTKGYSKHFKYQVPYTRKSGDPNTSCGNSLINGATSFQTCLDLGLNNFKSIVLGDDLLTIMSQKELMKQRIENFSPLWNGDLDMYYRVKRSLGVKENLRLKYLFQKISLEQRMEVFCDDYAMYMKSYGFKAKCGWSRRLCDAEFCSALFWPVGDTYVLGPKIGRLMPKMGFCLKMLLKTQIQGVYKGYEYMANHVPILSEFIQWHLDKTTTDVYILNPYSLRNSERHQMDDQTIEFFEERYGVDYYSECNKFMSELPDSNPELPMKILLPSGLLEPYFTKDN